jgi:hypothetical protein
MSNIIIDPNNLVQDPQDGFWDKPVSRRAFQAQLHSIGKHIADLWAAADTAGILLNFIMEKKLLKEGETPEQLRDEVEKFVEEKKAQLAAIRANAVAQVGVDEQPE